MASDTQRAAELQVLLEGVPLPASKDELLDYASRQTGAERFLVDLRSLPDREYRSLDEVGEELAPVHTAPPSAKLPPAGESDLPPGGDAYVDPNAEPGALRPDWPEDNPPQKAIEQQTKTQKEQAERRSGGG